MVKRYNTFQSSPPSAINAIAAKQVSHARSRGIRIDDYLSWDVFCKKVASRTSALNKAFCFSCLSDSQKSHLLRPTIATAVIVFKPPNAFYLIWLSFYEHVINCDNVIYYNLSENSGKLAVPQPRNINLKDSFSYCGAVQLTFCQLTIGSCYSIVINI